MLDILVRMRDMTDTHNIAPIISQLLTDGYSCAIVCDSPGKAFQALTANFLHLLSITTQVSSCEKLYNIHPSTNVYFGSMLPDDIGRNPFIYYKKQGALTATIQETPGWRLTNWDAYPDIIFTMPGGKEVIQTRWSNFTGETYETGMPQYEHIPETLTHINKVEVRRRLRIPDKAQVISINIPAYYAKETISIIEETINELSHVIFLSSLHPKATLGEKNVYRNFCEKTSQVIDCSDGPLVERLAISTFTIGSVVSTTLVTASLCGSIPIALTNPSAQKELEELGGYKKPGDFPYINKQYFTTAQNTQELLCKLKSTMEITKFSVSRSTKVIVQKLNLV